MKMLTLNSLREKRIIAYEYIRGSQLYNTSLEDGKSDIDIGGVYIAPIEDILGLPKYYQDQVSDEKNDITFYEVGKWLELLVQSNPNALESLYVPKDKIIGNIHPAIQLILDNKDKFLTKKCFNSFYGYAIQQIKRARGLNKKIVNPVTERKGVLDFCYTTQNQGSTHIQNWLKRNGLKQEYCGLVCIANMRDTYGVYYDWGAHKQFLIDNNSSDEQKIALVHTMEKLDSCPECLNVWFGWNNYIKEPYHYKGIVKIYDEETNTNESTDVRLSSVEKNEKPICILQYNKDGYVKHCKDYREFKEWEKRRNPVRYESNLNKNYDAKNVMHTVRLMHMAYEIASGQGFNVVRTWDRQFLLDIRNHKYEYDYLINYVDDFKKKMENAMITSTLPEEVDESFVNNLLINVRKLTF